MLNNVFEIMKNNGYEDCDLGELLNNIEQQLVCLYNNIVSKQEDLKQDLSEEEEKMQGLYNFILEFIQSVKIADSRLKYNNSEDIISEIKYTLEKANKMADITANDRVYHCIALGNIMALNDILYSVKWNDWRFKKEDKQNV